MALSHWVLCGSLFLDWSDAEYAFLFWMQGGVPSQFRMSPGMRWYTAVGLHTMQGISDKLRELTHYDHGASAVNQALHGIQDALQCTASHRCRFEDNSLVWVIPTGTPHVEPATIGCDDEIAAGAGADCAAEVSSLLQNTAVQRVARASRVDNGQRPKVCSPVNESGPRVCVCALGTLCI